MKTNKVLKILQITRPTLTKYVKVGKIRVITKPNGFYDYNEDDVYSLAGYSTRRLTVAYSRVSTNKQKKDLENQEKSIVSYCNNNGIRVDKSYKDIASGMNFDRKQFLEMFNDIIDRKIQTVYITHKDRLSRISFDLFEKLFREFGCEIIVINNTEDRETNESEIFGEIISMLHCFAMKMYSKRRKNKLEIVSKDLENEISL